MKLFIKLCILLNCLTASLFASDAVDLVVFSKNRPLQLYAFLESCEQYLAGANTISIIYYADSVFAPAYDEVKTRFPYAQFLQQKELGARGDFKKLTVAASFTTDSPYIIFAVDDIVMIDAVDLRRCAQLLEQYQAYGFYLRLGTDITECYSENRHTGCPTLKLREQDVYSWKFFRGTGDWGYPNTVDMTLFKKSDIQAYIKEMPYHSPNTFEGRWSGHASSVMQRRGLCFTTSKIVNFPLNLVQNDWNNRHSGECDPIFLLEKFQQGLKMDIAALHQFPHKAPHADYVPTFVMR